MQTSVFPVSHYYDKKEYSSPSRRILLIRPKCTYNITKCNYRYKIFNKMGCNRYLDKCIPQFGIYYRRSAI